MNIVNYFEAIGVLDSVINLLGLFNEENDLLLDTHDNQYETKQYRATLKLADGRSVECESHQNHADAVLMMIENLIRQSRGINNA